MIITVPILMLDEPTGRNNTIFQSREVHRAVEECSTHKKYGELLSRSDLTPSHRLDKIHGSNISHGIIQLWIDSGYPMHLMTKLEVLTGLPQGRVLIELIEASKITGNPTYKFVPRMTGTRKEGSPFIGDLKIITVDAYLKAGENENIRIQTDFLTEEDMTI